MRSLARLRGREALAAEIAVLRRQITDAHGRETPAADFPRGALDALRWITDGGPAPLTGALTMLPVPLETLVSELAAAEAIIYGRISRHRSYACGVEHALMWARCATAAPPSAHPPVPDGPAARLTVSGGDGRSHQR